MISKFAFLSNILLASVTLAGTVLSNDWAGAVVSENNGTFNYVTANFTVPNPSGVPGSGLSIWVGIGDYACSDVFLAGVDVKIVLGGVSCRAWFQSNSRYPYNNFTRFLIHPGNIIKTSITMTSALSAKALIENLTSGGNVTQELDVGSSAADTQSCWNNAEWSVGGIEMGRNYNFPLANFSSITLINATATSSSGINYNPLNATTIGGMIGTNIILTSVALGEDNLTVKFL